MDRRALPIAGGPGRPRLPFSDTGRCPTPKDVLWFHVNVCNSPEGIVHPLSICSNLPNAELRGILKKKFLIMLSRQAHFWMNEYTSLIKEDLCNITS